MSAPRAKLANDRTSCGSSHGGRVSKKKSHLSLSACAEKISGLSNVLSDGGTTPVSPLTNPKGKRDEPLNPASDLESEVQLHSRNLEAPRPGLGNRGGDRVQDKGLAVTMQGDELKALRQGLGLSQADFAEAIGLSRVLIGQMERGQAPIEKRTAMAARYLMLTKGGDAPSDGK